MMYHMYSLVLLFCCALTLGACPAPLPGPPDKTKPSDLRTNLPQNILAFGNIQANKSQVKSFVLYNRGGSTSLTDIYITDDLTRSFRLVQPPSTPHRLDESEVDQGLELTVEFAPKAVASALASLVIRYDDGEGSKELVVQLQFEVKAFVSWSCKGRLDFGPVAPDIRVKKTCSLVNTGRDALLVQGVRYQQLVGGKAQDFTWDTPLPLTVPAGQAHGVEITISYHPSDTQPLEDAGRFVLQTQLHNAPELRVSGSLLKPSLRLVPEYPSCQSDADCSSFDPDLRCKNDGIAAQRRCLFAKEPVLRFGPTLPGKTSRRSFWVQNTGDAAVKIDAIELKGSPQLRLSSPSSGFALGPRTEKKITVEYASNSGSAGATGRVFVHNSVTLVSLPIETAGRGCNIDVQPRKIEFPGPKSVQVTVLNRGSESCIVRKVSLRQDNPHFSLLPQPQPDQTLAPNGSMAFLVKFSPKSNRSLQEKLLISSTDPNEPLIAIDLVARIVDPARCELSATPGTLNFGLVPVGRSRKMRVRVENKGHGDCDISSVHAAGTNPSGNGAFRLATDGLKTPLKLSAGGSLLLDVSYTPPAERSGYEGVLELHSNDARQPKFQVKLVGSSGILCLEILPPHLDFGSSKFGCATPKRSIEIFHLGSARCSNSISVTGIKLANNPNGEFRLHSAPTTPRTLTPSQSARVELSYKPKDLGVDTANLSIENSVPGQSPVLVPLVGEGVSISDQKDLFKQTRRPQMDILFVVDDSSSMGDEQQALATNFKSFITWAVRVNADYHIMITTTDVHKSGALGPGCARGAGAKVITPQTPDPVGTFAANVKVGTSGSASEKGLEAAYRALLPPASTGCNKGFYRKDANLSIIFVSDEPDSSPQTVQFYVSFFKSLKGIRNAHKLRASAIVGPPPSGCRAPQTGSASAGPRYWEVAKQLKGIQESVCTQKWGDALSKIGSVSLGFNTTFYLSRQADPKTLAVKVNGNPTKNDPNDGWSYDASTNSVVFSKSQIPSPGATIEIQYKATCLP